MGNTLGQPRRQRPEGKEKRAPRRKGFGRQGHYQRQALAFGDAFQDPMFRSIFLKIVGNLAGFIPVAGPFISQVLLAMADNPDFNFGDFLKEMFTAGAGVFMKMLAEAALGAIMPPGASKMLKLAAKIAPAVAGAVGKAAAKSTIKQAGKAGKMLNKARREAMVGYKKNRR